MGPPLGPVLAYLFLGFHESHWIYYFAGKVIFYCRYVDDILSFFYNIEEATCFLEYLSNRHPIISFTMGTENTSKMVKDRNYFKTEFS